MKEISVKEGRAEQLCRILSLFGRLDDIRWADETNYSILEEREGQAADELLLANWLLCITNRQRPWLFVQQVGSFVLSPVVEAYSRGQRWSDLLNTYVEVDLPDWKSPCFTCEASEQERKRLEIHAKSVRSGSVIYAPRYPADTYAVLRTLIILDETSNRSLAGFLESRAFEETPAKPSPQVVNKLARALYALTYAYGTTWSAKELRETILCPEKLRRKALEDWESAETIIAKEVHDCSSWRWQQKRLWTALRDYLKHDRCNEIFRRALSLSNMQSWKAARLRQSNREALSVLELPGDVWNNYPALWKGLIEPHVKMSGRWQSPHLIRRIYEEVLGRIQERFHPEQFDVTWNFTSRMCAEGNCDVCLFNGGAASLCHGQQGTLCPIALFSCGFRYKCRGTKDECGIVPDEPFCKPPAGLHPKL